jgi:ribosome-associated heat shock protein Hsp15
MSQRHGREPLESVRIDRWLWAARFYKTRTAATAAVAGGKVELNGETAKPSRPVICGDNIRVRIAPHEWRLTVTGLGERRGSAAIAATLYDETEESIQARETREKQLRDAPMLKFDGGKPSKQDRRALRKLKG